MHLQLKEKVVTFFLTRVAVISDVNHTGTVRRAHRLLAVYLFAQTD
jgi:hypothetical protein